MKRVFFDFIRKDIWRKLFALTITVVLFGNLYEQKERELPGVRVRIRHDPEVYVDQTEPRVVRLTVKGAKERVEKLTSGQFSGQIRLENSAEALRTGWANLTLTADNFTGPPTVSIVAIDPSALNIPVQRRVIRKLRIVPHYDGTPGKNKVVTAVRLTPDTVTVSGPEKHLAELSGIPTQAFSIAGETGDVTFRKIRLQNPVPGKLELSVAAVEAAVEIREPTEFPHRFERIPLRLLVAPELAGRVTAETREAALTVTGTQDEIGRVKAEDFTVYVNADRLNAPGEYYLSPTALPERFGNTVRVIRIEPEKVKVTLAPPVRAADAPKKQ